MLIWRYFYVLKGGGLGGTRRGGPEVNIKHSGREDNERERERYRLEREKEDREGPRIGRGERERERKYYAGFISCATETSYWYGTMNMHIYDIAKCGYSGHSNSMRIHI